MPRKSARGAELHIGDDFRAFRQQVSRRSIVPSANATRILFVGRANAGYDLGVLDVETCDPWPNTMIPSIGRCGVPPCECCDLAVREMGLLAPCA